MSQVALVDHLAAIAEGFAAGIGNLVDDFVVAAAYFVCTGLAFEAVVNFGHSSLAGNFVGVVVHFVECVDMLDLACAVGTDGY